MDRKFVIRAVVSAGALALAATMASGSQSRAAAPPSTPALRAVTVAQGVEMGWALAFLPGGDELNLTQRGRNYGWPVITFGEQYGGGKIGAGISAQAGMEQPATWWKPSIATFGLARLASDRYGAEWNGDLFVGSLKFNQVVRVPMGGARAGVPESVIELGERVRDVRHGPDGFLYVLTEGPRGRIIRLEPIAKSG